MPPDEGSDRGCPLQVQRHHQTCAEGRQARPLLTWYSGNGVPLLPLYLDSGPSSGAIRTRLKARLHLFPPSCCIYTSK
jgi:hypothetical protein